MNYVDYGWLRPIVGVYFDAPLARSAVLAAIT